MGESVEDLLTHAPDDSDQLIAQIFTTDSIEVRDAVIQQILATLAKNEGPQAILLLILRLVDAVITALGDQNSDTVVREGAALTLQALSQSGASRVAVEIAFVDLKSGLLDALLDTFSDESLRVRVAAIDAVCSIVRTQNSWATNLVLPPILRRIKTAANEEVAGALEVLNRLIRTAPVQAARAMPNIVPVLVEATQDMDAKLKRTARDTLTLATGLVSDGYIKPIISQIIEALTNWDGESWHFCIQRLFGVTCVSKVDIPNLSLIAPILFRGLHDTSTTISMVAVVIDHIFGLVDSPEIAQPFIRILLPSLVKIERTVNEPEVRTVVTQAISKLRQVGRIPTSSDGSDLPPPKVIEPASLADSLAGAYRDAGGPIPSLSSEAAVHVLKLAEQLILTRADGVSEWESFVPYFAFIASQPAPKDIIHAWVLKCAAFRESNAAVTEPLETFLHYRYGFNLQMQNGSEDGPPGVIPEGWDRMRVIMGEPDSPVDDRYVTRIMDFMTALIEAARPSPILSDLCDLESPPLRGAKHLREVVVRRFGEQTFYSFEKFGAYRDPQWVLMTPSAAGVLECLRRGIPSVTQAANYFVKKGIPLSTRIVQPPRARISYHPNTAGSLPYPLQGLPPPPLLPLILVSTGLGRRPPGFTPDAADYAAYRKVRDAVLHQPRARAALLGGGIVWRLAVESLMHDTSAVLNGPSDEVYTRGHNMTSPDGREFWDDALSLNEVEIICGVYKVNAGGGRQNADLSWWPKPSAWQASGLNVGYWSPACESWFQKRLKSIKTNTAGLKNGGEWKDAMKYFRKQASKLTKNYEAFAAQYLADQELGNIA